MNINATLIFQAITFFIFVVFCMKYIWPPVIAALQERQRKIADGLSAASRAERDFELAREKVAEQLRVAKLQATEIIEQANKKAGIIIDEACEKATIEAQNIINQAKSNLEQEINIAKDGLRLELSGLAVLGAEKILNAQIDKKANSLLVEELIDEL